MLWEGPKQVQPRGFIQSQKGFGLPGVLMASGLSMILALLVTNLTVSQVEVSTKMEASGVAASELQRFTLKFKSKDNSVDMLRSPSSGGVWQPVMGGRSAWEEGKEDGRMLIRRLDETVHTNGKFPLVESVDDPGPEHTNAWLLVDNAANMALARYNLIDNGNDYCNGNNGWGHEITNDQSFPRLSEQLSNGRVFLRIQRQSPEGRIDCAHMGSLKMIPSGNTTVVGDTPNTPGQGLVLTTRILYDTANQQGKVVTARSVVKPDADLVAPEFRSVATVPAGAVSMSSGKMVLSSVDTTLRSASADLDGDNVVENHQAFCGSPEKALSLTVSTNEQAVVFTCALEKKNGNNWDVEPYRACEAATFFQNVKVGIKSVGAQGDVTFDLVFANEMAEGWYRLKVKAYDAAQNHRPDDGSGASSEVTATFGVDLTRPQLEPIVPLNTVISNYSSSQWGANGRGTPNAKSYWSATKNILEARFNRAEPFQGYQCRDITNSRDGFEGKRDDKRSGMKIVDESVTWERPIGQITGSTGNRLNFNGSLPDGVHFARATIRDVCGMADTGATQTVTWIKDTSPPQRTVTRNSLNTFKLKEVKKFAQSNAGYLFEHNSGLGFEVISGEKKLNQGSACLPNNLCGVATDGCGRTRNTNNVLYERAADIGESCLHVNCKEGLICGRSGINQNKCFAGPPAKCFADTGCPGAEECHGCGGSAGGFCGGVDRFAIAPQAASQCENLGDSLCGLANAPIQPPTNPAGCADCVPDGGSCSADSDCCNSDCSAGSCGQPDVTLTYECTGQYFWDTDNSYSGKYKQTYSFTAPYNEVKAVQDQPDGQPSWDALTGLMAKNGHFVKCFVDIARNTFRPQFCKSGIIPVGDPKGELVDVGLHTKLVSDSEGLLDPGTIFHPALGKRLYPSLKAVPTSQNGLEVLCK